MDSKNYLPLTIKVYDYNIAAQTPYFIQMLRLLTLNPQSGMNYELDNFARIHLERDVDCKIITAYHNEEFVGWALLSGETTDFCFMRSPDGFNSSEGYLFQVYVQPTWRRCGIGAQLLETAKRHLNGKQICICPWDTTSHSFYENQKFEAAKYL